jgi:hypothetical protein
MAISGDHQLMDGVVSSFGISVPSDILFLPIYVGLRIHCTLIYGLHICDLLRFFSVFFDFASPFTKEFCDETRKLIKKTSICLFADNSTFPSLPFIHTDVFRIN